MTPHDDFLIAMFNDDPRLVQEFRRAETKRAWIFRINWRPLLGALVALAVSAAGWTVIIYAVLYVKGWLTQ